MTKKIENQSVHKIHIFDFWPTIISNSISTLNNNSLFYKDYKVSQILNILFIRKKIYENKRTDTKSPSKWFSVHIF